MRPRWSLRATALLTLTAALALQCAALTTNGTAAPGGSNSAPIGSTSGPSPASSSSSPAPAPSASAPAPATGVTSPSPEAASAPPPTPAAEAPKPTPVPVAAIPSPSPPSPSPPPLESPSPSPPPPTPPVFVAQPSSPPPVATPTPVPVAAPVATPSQSPSPSPSPVTAPSPAPAASPSPSPSPVSSPVVSAPTPAALASPPPPAAFVTIGVEYALTGTGLVPLNSSLPGTFGEALYSVLNSEGVKDTAITYVGNQVVSDGSSSGRRRLLQAASDSVAVFYDIAKVPSGQSASVTSTLGSSSTASALVAALTAAGFAVTGVRLVRSTNGAITVTAAAPSPAVSSGSSGISGGAIAGIIVGVIALLLVAALLLWFCYFKPRRQRNAALAAEAKGPPSAPVGVRTAEPFDAYAVKGPETGNQGHAYISTDSAGHSGTIPAVPAMQRLSDQSAHAPSPTKLLSEGREASNAPDYVAPQREHHGMMSSMARRFSGRLGPAFGLGPSTSPFAPTFANSGPQPRQPPGASESSH